MFRSPAVYAGPPGESDVEELLNPPDEEELLELLLEPPDELVFVG